MKTLVLGLALTLAHSGIARADDAQLRIFATCAGRLSAIMEHQWMFDGPASEQTQIHRTHVLDLVAATMQDGQGREVLNWRLSGKRAQNQLLTRATFNDDDVDAAWAAAQATRYERACTAFLLS